MTGGARLLRLLLVLAALTATIASGRAHEFMPALLSIETRADGSHDVLFKLPLAGGSAMALAAEFPPGCARTDGATRQDASGATLRRYRLDCSPPLAGQRVTITGLEATPTDVMVRVHGPSGAVQSARVLAAAPFFIVDTAPTALGVATTYTLLGAHHILLGLDHVLFVLALLLLIRRRGVLLWTITAFTVAHSITLAVSALGVATVRAPAVEALVALSIVFLAAEVLKDGGQRPRLAPPLVAFAFGLLHGLGFGGALMEIGLPPGEIPLALVSFNVGVELGQLLVVALALLLTLSLRRLLAWPLAALRPAIAYGIGAVAAVWFVERLVGIVTAA